ncbi:MAG: Uncharacterized protein G01um101416_364 [Microgenomates group bacterium Gr01-1014_16]|nr:MAG: Uncharacterized protein G01um101416_364 [Microgenomates group bacterium Gr01-1014_16]
MPKTKSKKKKTSAKPSGKGTIVYTRWTWVAVGCLVVFLAAGNIKVTQSLAVGGRQVLGEDEDRETEIKTATGQVIKTKIEDDGSTKVEIEEDGLKFKYAVENGQVRLEAEKDEAEELELDDDDIDELENEIEDEFEDEGIEIEASEGGRLSIMQNRVSAITNFPLSVDSVTRQLIITTPTGRKTVTILPEEALLNLLATGIVNRIETGSASAEFAGKIKLEVRGNDAVYRVEGRKHHRLLGFISLTLPVTAFVSAETGTTVARQQSLLTSIVDLLSL